MPEPNSSTPVPNSPRPPAWPSCPNPLMTDGKRAATFSASTPSVARASIGNPSRPTTTTASTPLRRASAPTTSPIVALRPPSIRKENGRGKPAPRGEPPRRAPALFPTGAINLGQLSGLQRSTTAFDAIKLAPTGGYVFDKPIALDTGTVVLVRSRPIQCLFGTTVSLYAKLRVVVVDSTARRLDMETLVDQNCGYRGLEPGLPNQ